MTRISRILGNLEDRPVNALGASIREPSGLETPPTRETKGLMSKTLHTLQDLGFH